MPILPRMRYYVYLLSSPDGTPFYIGKGSGRRVLRHEIEARNGCECYKCRTIRKIWRDGGQVQQSFVLETDDEQAAFDAEIALIAYYGRENLTNLTDGGDGAAHEVSDETRAILREVLPRVFSTPEARANRSAAAKARWSRKEEREAQSERIKERLADPETIARKSASRKALWADPETRQRHIAALQAGRQTEQAKRNQHEGTKAAWARRKNKS